MRSPNLTVEHLVLSGEWDVGHKIEVTGVAVPASQAEAEKNVPKAEHYMKLSGIKMVSTSCP